MAASRFCSPRVMLLLLLLLRALPRGSARSFFTSRGHCDLGSSPIVTLIWDNGNGAYRESNVTVAGAGDRLRRRRNLAPSQFWLGDAVIDDQDDDTKAVAEEEVGRQQELAATAQRRLQHASPPRAIEMRKCPCLHLSHRNTTYYCPIDKEFCFLPFGSRVPTCVNEPNRNAFVKTVWIPTLMCFVLILFCIFCSIPGHHVLEFIIANFFCCCLPYREWSARRLLRNNPSRAERMIRNAQRRRQQTLEQRVEGADTQLPVAVPVSEESTPSGPLQIALKTRRYQRDKDHSMPTPSKEEFSNSSVQLTEEEEEILADCGDACCAICFAPLQDNERVGVLDNCSHLFHVDCLKTWLTRRNVCPLCLNPAASPASPEQRTPLPPPPFSAVTEHYLQ